MTQGMHIELAPYRTSEGVSDEQLLAASEQLHVALHQGRPGFLGRMLLRKTAREWVDLVFWRSADDAREAMKAAGGDAACARYFGLMQLADSGDPEAGVEHLYEVRRYDGAPACAPVPAGGIRS